MVVGMAGLPTTAVMGQYWGKVGTTTVVGMPSRPLCSVMDQFRHSFDLPTYNNASEDHCFMDIVKYCVA